MKIPLKTDTPSNLELIETLKNESSQDLNFEQFGLSDRNTIIVKKSFWVGAEISCNQQFITIEGLIPTVGISFISNFLSLFITGFAAPLWRIIDLFGGSNWRKLEKELGHIIYREYGDHIPLQGR